MTRGPVQQRRGACFGSMSRESIRAVPQARTQSFKISGALPFLRKKRALTSNCSLRSSVAAEIGPCALRN